MEGIWESCLKIFEEYSSQSRQRFFYSSSSLLFQLTGTIIPQQKEVDEYVFHYGETLYQLFDLFGLSNVFGSWWFRLLLVLLMVNLVACSTSRLPRFLAQKGLTKREWVGRLGPHLTHFSLIVILAGSLIGNLWGFKGYVNIPQGETISAVAVREFTSASRSRFCHPVRQVRGKLLSRLSDA